MKFYPENDMAMSKLEWASFKKAFSFNVKFNHFIGGWGYGKTYGIKSFLFEKFVKCGHTFVWLRKTEESLKGCKSTEQFFGRMGGVIEKLGIKNYKVYGNKIFINDKIAGYFAAVSTPHNTKGADFKVKYAVFDEFLREFDERPIHNIRQKFLRCLESFGRDEIKRVFLISNAVNQYDPMLEYLSIELNEFGCYVYREKDTLVHYMKPSKKYVEKKADGTVGVSMTAEQMAQAYQNKFEVFDEYSSDTKLKYMFSIVIGNNQYLSFYLSNDGCIVKSKIPVNAKLLTYQRIYVNSKIEMISTAHKKYIQSLYNSGRMKFEDGYCRTAFISEIS